jgi:drug/metabolite transporter (DMT)-like permease
MTRRAWVLFVVISLLWGLPYLLIKVAVADVEPTVVVFVRVAVSALVLLPLALVRGALRPLAGHWRVILALSVLEVAAPFLLIAFGEQHITSSLAGLLIAADPLFIVLLALRFDASERAGGRRLVGLLLGFLGVVVLLGLDPGGDALGLLGGAMVLLAAVCYAAGALLIKRLADVPPLGSVAASLSLASLWLLPAALLTLPNRLPSGTVVASLLLLGLGCTALGFIVYFSLIAAAGATRGSLITYVNPAVAVVLGVAVLHEPLTAATLAGFGLILAGCWLSTRTAPPLRTDPTRDRDRGDTAPAGSVRQPPAHRDPGRAPGAY